jgi:ABC-type nitrate/sulfonate/bicarbonate transport system substrate-binding protein
MKSQKNPDTHILIDNTARYTPPFPNFVAVASNKWVQDHPEAAQKVVATLLDEARLFSKDEAAWIKLASRYFPDVAQDELSSTWKSLTENGLWAVNGGVNFEATEGLMKSYFEVRGDKPNDKLSKGADVYNTGPLKAVLDQKGVIADSKDVPDWFKK